MDDKLFPSNEHAQELFNNLASIIADHNPKELATLPEFLVAVYDVQSYCHLFGMGAHIGVGADKKPVFFLYQLDPEMQQIETHIGKFIQSLGIPLSPN